MYGGRIAYSDADAVVARLHGHLRDRRHDRRAAGGAAGGFRAAQQPVPGGAFPQRHHRRRAVRRVRRLHLLVPQGVRLPAARGPGQGGVLVLARRLLSRVHAALRAGPDGHDAAHAALRCAGWHPWLLIAAVGAAIILAGIILQIAQLVVSIRNRERAARQDRRSLERPLAGMGHPVAAAGVQFRGSAACRGRGCLLGHQAARAPSSPGLTAKRRAMTTIEMPRNSPTGFICAFFATFMGFALIWHIWWLVVAGALGAFATFVVFAWRDEDEYVIPAEEVARIDRANRGAPRGSCPGGSDDMTAVPLSPDRADLSHAGGHGHAGARTDGGPAPKRIVVGYGFWIS